MLGLLGLLSAMLAGIMGDSLVSAQPSPDDSGDVPPTDEPGDEDVAPIDDPEGVMDDPDPDLPEQEIPEPPVVERPDPLPGEDADSGRPAQVLFGTNDAELLYGAAGRDAVFGAGGEDTLAGGAGDDALVGADDDEADLLLGEAGHDVLTLGAGDIATGGEGDDRFALADFGPNTPPSVITDYSAEDDHIFLMYDPDMHPDPVVSMAQVEGTDDMSVLLDGVQIAIVQGALGLTEADIQLLAA